MQTARATRRDLSTSGPRRPPPHAVTATGRGAGLGACLLALSLAATAVASPHPSRAPAEGPPGAGAGRPGEAAGTWWRPGYLVDYGLIALGGAGYLARNMEPTTSALFGPVYDPKDPAAILDARYSDRLGRRYLQEDEGETVPASAVVGLIGAGGLYLLAERGLGLLGDDPDRVRALHDTLVGYLETVALTGGLNAVLKNAAGRLRPDFQDRARRYHCARGELDAADCAGVSGPLHPDPKENEKIWLDGRRSFMSGHAASAMNFTTYLGLSIGGQLVWGEGASALSRGLGMAAQTLLLSTGVFIAASRIDDGRHHFGDVMTGAAFGFAMANLSYWRRFGLDGRPRPRAPWAKTAISLEPGPGDAGIAIAVRCL